MKLKIYCIYDSKGENFGKQPHFFENRADSIRAFQQAVNDPQSMWSKYPADYTLFEIGEWDQMEGVITMYETKMSLGLALEYKNKPATETPLFENQV